MTGIRSKIRKASARERLASRHFPVRIPDPQATYPVAVIGGTDGAAAAVERMLTSLEASKFLRLRVRPKTSARVTKLSQHEANGGEFQEREGVAVEIFPILGEAAATIEPRNRTFDDPALG